MYVQEHGESGLVGTQEGPTGLSGEQTISVESAVCLFLIEESRIQDQGLIGAEVEQCARGSRLPAALNCLTRSLYTDLLCSTGRTDNVPWCDA